jgi:hypothetical protein
MKEEAKKTRVERLEKKINAMDAKKQTPSFVTTYFVS